MAFCENQSEGYRIFQMEGYRIFPCFQGYELSVNENQNQNYVSPVKRICVFEHSVMTNFNCACPAIQRSQGSGFLSEGSS